MAAVSLTSWFGAFAKRPTAAELQAAEDLEHSQASALKRKHIEYPVVMQCVSFQTPSASAGSDTYSPVWPIPFSLSLIAADLGCNTAAGATGTMDVEVSTDNGGTWASVFSAAKDVKTAAGTMARYAVNADTGSTSRDLTYGTGSSTVLMRVKATSGSGGALAGGCGVLWFRQA